MAPVLDRELLALLEQHGGSAGQFDAWRGAWASRPVLQASVSAGRWNPPNAFEVLYTALSTDAAIAEVYHHLSEQPVLASAEKLLYPIRIKTANTLRLTDPAFLTRLGLGPHSLALTDVARSQEVGAAAHLLEFDSIEVPSARWPGSNLMLIAAHFDLDSIEVLSSQPLNVAAWREKNAPAWEARREAMRAERMALAR